MSEAAAALEVVQCYVLTNRQSACAHRSVRSIMLSQQSLHIGMLTCTMCLWLCSYNFIILCLKKVILS